MDFEKLERDTTFLRECFLEVLTCIGEAETAQQFTTSLGDVALTGSIIGIISAAMIIFGTGLVVRFWQL
ncbi:MAG: hypothetical protein H0V56_14000 [Chthoniobacterales bacterium]|nr:hypothetical protein [Chthoniobacterales bacterium]